MTNWGLYLFVINTNHLLDVCLAFYISPLLTVLLGVIFYKEKITKAQWCAVFVTCAGILNAVVSNEMDLWLMIGIASTFAIYCSMKKIITVSPQMAMLFEIAIPSLFSLVCLFLFQAQNYDLQYPGGGYYFPLPV